MSAITLPFIGKPSRPLPALLMLALVFGCLDILDALLFWGFSMDVPPMQVLQGIASGLLGSTAFHGGAGTALLGALLQYGIFFCLLALYYLAAIRFALLVRMPLGYGLFYGLLSSIVMRYGILPLTAFHIVPGFYPAAFVNSTLAQTLFVGLPAAFMAHRLNSNGETPHPKFINMDHAAANH